MKILIFILIFLPVNAEKIKDASFPIFGSKEIHHLKKNNLGKKTIINFWASWCTACVKELEELETLKKNYPDYNYVAINAGEKNKKIKKFYKKYKFSYKILLDDKKEFSKSVGVLELPRTIVVDKDLNILYNSAIPPKKL